MIRIVYMGTPDFAVEPLEAIIKAGYEVAAVVTQPDKQKGRGKEVKMTPVKECALRHGIPVFQPVKIKEPEAVAELEKYQADLFVVAVKSRQHLRIFGPQHLRLRGVAFQIYQIVAAVGPVSGFR